jgi:hypothetical protein
MATTRQKAAARRNVKKAQSVQSRGARGARETFAFPKQRKEPIHDARHVRNAIARFDQVEGVTDRERDAAWRRIRSAARKFGVDVSVKGWRSLMKGRRTGGSTTRRSAPRRPR